MKKMTPPKDLGKAMKAGYQPMFMTGEEIKTHFAPHQADKNTIDLPKKERANKYDIGERQETDSELWDRKLKESKQTGKQRYGKDAFARDRQGAYRSLVGPGLARQGIGPDTSLESVAKTKGIPGYVAVEAHADPAVGKQQLLGGHHRVALSAAQFPNHIFPVKYHNDLHEAKSERGYQ
jgi:hypothetical protein